MILRLYIPLRYEIKKIVAVTKYVWDTKMVQITQVAFNQQGVTNNEIVLFMKVTIMKVFIKQQTV